MSGHLPSEAEIRTGDAPPLLPPRPAPGPVEALERAAGAPQPHPTVGRAVHYWPADPDVPERWCAALITGTAESVRSPWPAVRLSSPRHAHLHVFSLYGSGSLLDVPYDLDGAPGTWSWPPRV